MPALGSRRARAPFLSARGDIRYLRLVGALPAAGPVIFNDQIRGWWLVLKILNYVLVPV
jgi:hypothetical protein